MTNRRPTVAVQVGLWTLIYCATLGAPDAQAGTGQKSLLPSPAAVPKHGIRLAVDSQWVEGRGYRPIRIAVTATMASQADRTVSVSLRSNSWNARLFSMRVQQDIDLPAGATTAKATVAIPSFEPWYQLSMDVLVDDVVANELSGPLPGINQGNGWNAENPRIVVIGSGNEGIKEFRQVVDAFMAHSDANYAAAQQQVMAQQQALAKQQNGNQPLGVTNPLLPTLYVSETTALVAAADLPTRWIDYSSLDIVYVSLGNIRILMKQHPQTLRAILDWAATGGNLWISGVGTEYEHLSEIEQACELPSEKNGGPKHPGWHATEKVSERMWPPNNILSEGYGYEDSAELTREDAIGQSAEEATVGLKPSPEIQAPDHLWRDYSLGRIVVLASDQFQSRGGPQQGKHRQIVKLLDFRRHQWTHRHGLSPWHGSRDFWNFLIPGVGLAPVGAFRVLITVFVVVIGPVNFFFLRRWKRINLLLLTVPVSAALITLGLFTYALVNDGLGTRDRVRSYVELDQRDGRLVAWARQSYYAGLTPSSGLEFPKDTAVLPLRDSQSNPYGYYNNQEGRDIEWHDQQHLTEGWLKARTPTQYVTVRRAKTSTELKIFKEGGSVKVTNRLGARLVDLILIDEQGSYHTASNVALDETVTLRSINKKQSSKIVREQFQNHAPRIPEHIQQRNYGGVFDLNNSYYSPSAYSSTGGTFDNPGQGTSRMEQALTALQLAGGPRRPRSYVAFLENSPEVPLGLEDIDEDASFHVIEGRW